MKNIAPVVNILGRIGVLTVTLTIALAANFAYGQWTNPPSSPPNGNVATPVNVSSTMQAKPGTLGVQSLDVTSNAPTIEFIDMTGNRNGRIRANNDWFAFSFADPSAPSGDRENTLQLDSRNPNRLMLAGDNAQMHAANYCDENGQNCIDAEDLGGINTRIQNIELGGGSTGTEFDPATLREAVRDTIATAFNNGSHTGISFSHNDNGDSFQLTTSGGDYSGPNISNEFRLILQNQQNRAMVIGSENQWDVCFLTGNMPENTTDAGGCVIDEPRSQPTSDTTWRLRGYSSDSGGSRHYCYAKCMSF